MNLKKYALIIPALALAVGVAAPMQNVNAQELPTAADAIESQQAQTFAICIGTVTEIRKAENSTLIRVEDDKGGMIDFITAENTLLVNQKGTIALVDIKEGDTLTAYYVLPQITTMIYPAQYQATVLVKEDAGIAGVTVDYFDENMLSATGDLKLNIDPQKPVFDQNGNVYEGELADKALVIFSSMHTMSLPAQTTPDQIIVLDLETENIEDNELGIDLAKIAEMPIYADGMIVEEASAYAKGTTVMVPLRKVAEGLGYDVVWEKEDNTVRVGAATTVEIGKDAYTLGKMMPVELGTAAEIKKGTTYVPIQFFTDLLGNDFKVEGHGLYFQNIVAK